MLTKQSLMVDVKADALKRLAENPTAKEIISVLDGFTNSGHITINPDRQGRTLTDRLNAVKEGIEVYFDTLLQHLGVTDGNLKLEMYPAERNINVSAGPSSGGILSEPGVDIEKLVATSNVTLADIGGYDEVKQEIRQLIRLFENEEHFKSFGVEPPRGILFAGPPGTGKTMFAKAMCKELGVAFYHVSTSDVLNSLYGESEKRLSEIFEGVRTPCVLFVDELEALAPNRDLASEPSRRVLTELLKKLDGMASREGVIFLGATNKPEMLDPAITRAGRLDRTIIIDYPDEAAREAIFEACINRHQQRPATELASLKSLNCKDLAKATEGFVGADITEVMRRLVFDIADSTLPLDGIPSNRSSGGDSGLSPTDSAILRVYRYRDELDRKNRRL
jgi:AAA+ superfamily predicted ATPase